VRQSTHWDAPAQRETGKDDAGYTGARGTPRRYNWFACGQYTCFTRICAVHCSFSVTSSAAVLPGARSAALRAGLASSMPRLQQKQRDEGPADAWHGDIITASEQQLDAG